jgi:hypothetical protein
VASKSGQDAVSTKDVEELLDAVDLTLDRLKTLYEQYFLGIQKQAPSFIHNDVERKLRDLTQLNVRNTGLRYRLATLQQKFGSYNSYWRRTLRQIENGTYGRNLAKIGREAARTGADIPDEILAAMPKRMREQVLRDRDAALAIAKRRNQVPDEQQQPETDGAAMIDEPSVLRRQVKAQSAAHFLGEDDADIDFDSFFAAFEDDSAPPAKPEPARTAKPDPTTTQAITRPVPRTDLPLAARSPVSSQALETMPTHAPPRVAAPGTEPGVSAPHTSSLSRQQTGPVPIVTPPTTTSAIPRVPVDRVGGDASGAVAAPTAATAAVPRIPRVPSPAPQMGPMPKIPVPPGTRGAPSQQLRPNPIAPGAARTTGPAPVKSMSGPLPRSENPADAPRAPSPARPGQPPPLVRPPPPPPRPGTPPPRPGTTSPRAAASALKPPPGMTEADVNALHAKYVQAKQMVGEKVDASSRDKLLKTINQTAPKIMQQYKASGVDFSVVVKDNQVVIKAKPKT